MVLGRDQRHWPTRPGIRGGECERQGPGWGAGAQAQEGPATGPAALRARKGTGMQAALWGHRCPLSERQALSGASAYSDLKRLTSHTWEDAQQHSLSEKCKSKPQRGTITRQSGWLLPKSLQATNAAERVKKREPSYTVGGNAN